ncbi:poly(ADP-ribose) glycohydrolase 1-like isoform X2 [Andrographis paniculata]|uniref:poly(ADP-ribose) glycohydrolase 1-like isoform X2 n=1 Tax=Andrographis paniculata TaxID=175694 RepID=UPI0021E7E942|nr:poly(ADP-ribose) glycohydrolase 1-like isoform X2 [Andrographis paniculata]
MDEREDFQSIMPFLPLFLRSSSLFWQPAVAEFLKCLAKGPLHSKVNSGESFAAAISDMRKEFRLSPLHPSASLGFSRFFDSLMKADASERWFADVVPGLADLLLKLPVLLENHYRNGSICNGKETGLRLLESQQSGIVVMSQELIAALLACAFFCLYPTRNRGSQHLQPINFDHLFLSLYEHDKVHQEHKIKCILHYFERICSDMPTGNVSFERKVLPFKNCQSNIVYPGTDFWSNSTKSLCQLEVHNSGLIEDHCSEALEVDFANKYLGGGALGQGCVQEEIRFMINPELIIGILFSPAMEDNEAIEVVGAERFSNYSGYAASFRFCGDYVDEKSFDTMGRRKTRIVAIDALIHPGKRQYKSECLLRESNKAFCGFFNQQKANLLMKGEDFGPKHDMIIEEGPSTSGHNILTEDLSDSIQGYKRTTSCDTVEKKGNKVDQYSIYEDDGIGVATGNWGCGAFGGDPEVKVVIQWLAASQALRPFMLYYTFGLSSLQKLEEVAQWILSQGWTVGELWNILVEYSTQRFKGETTLGLFNWLLPSLYADDPILGAPSLRMKGS